MKWYYRIKNSGVEMGPLDTDALQQRVATGEIHTDCELRQGLTGLWFPMAMFAESLSLNPSSTTQRSESTTNPPSTSTPIDFIAPPQVSSNPPVPDTSDTSNTVPSPIALSPVASSSSAPLPVHPASPFDFLSTPTNKPQGQTNANAPSPSTSRSSTSELPFLTALPKSAPPQAARLANAMPKVEGVTPNANPTPNANVLPRSRPVPFVPQPSVSEIPQPWSAPSVAQPTHPWIHPTGIPRPSSQTSLPTPEHVTYANVIPNRPTVPYSPPAAHPLRRLVWGMAFLFGAVIFAGVAILFQSDRDGNNSSKESTENVDDSSSLVTLDASQAWQFDEDVEVVIRSVNRGQVEMRPEKQNIQNEPNAKHEIVFSESNFLKIYVTVRNRNNTKLLNFTGWNFVSSKPTLRDNYGNHYPMAKLDTKRMLQLQQDVSVYPNQEVTDLLVFDPPIETATGLKLQLSSEPFSGLKNADTNPVQMEFSIPITMVKNDTFETAIPSDGTSSDTSEKSKPSGTTVESAAPIDTSVTSVEKAASDAKNAAQSATVQKNEKDGKTPSKTPEAAFGLTDKPIQLQPDPASSEPVPSEPASSEP